MVGMSYISPRRVLRASARSVQWQFWSLVSVGIGVATVPLLARSDAAPSVEWVTPSTVLSAGLMLFNLGITWKELAETKRRLEALESALPLTYARKDVILEQFQSVREELRHVRTALEARE